ncbi:major facilitator superfamily domain-containing protein [Xylaria bambusicola]|uniref:major facilitator superfamily domain-containing protein n=1 Tax=Xylaria bambusicola TaxID=326684 RepID=UPI00200797D3|nr:major facilitator superfamily domain-containing protein [Xylaria bambusicola]KAI0521827.1 major facilitator superfamily domain-containing protein [Xylaria bambusicola]
MSTTPTTADEKLESQPCESVNGSQSRSSISEAHRQYVIERHGTDQLAPFPDYSDEDPYNWPRSKKWLNLAFVAFHGFMSTFTAGAIQSAFENIARDLHVSLQQASYLVSLVIAIIGIAPFFWMPLADRFGRRPILLWSLVIGLVADVGCAKSPSYATMAVCRAIAAIGASPAAAIGAGMVQEMFFKHQRGRYMGIWTVFVTLGVPIGPLVFGFVAFRAGYRWIYWVLAITSAVLLIIYFFYGAETRYIRGQEKQAPKGLFRSLFYRIDPTPMTLQDFVHPLYIARLPCVTLPTIAYAMVFALASVFPTILLPQLYFENFHFNTEEVGLQSISVIIGTIIGEQIGGLCSDRWMNSKKGKRHPPEYRLWLSFIGYALSIVGIAVFLVQLQHAGNMWNVTPTVGVGIAAVGNQLITTVMITYSVDCHHEEATSIGVFVSLVRQIWGFIGPFWFTPLIANVGLIPSTGVVIALIAVASIFPTILLLWKGRTWRTLDE